MMNATDAATPSSSAATYESLGAALDGRVVSTIDDVIDTMAFIDLSLRDDDGLKWFNMLYALVTQSIRAEVAAGRFANAAWIEKLDVVFARLYFEAVVAYERDPASCPRAWRPVFEARSNGSIARLQFALAGMNAHINRDLAIAVVETCATMGTTPKRGTPYFQDYNAINDVLERVEGPAMQTLATGFLRDAEVAMGRVDDIIAMWSIRHAREAAWSNAEVLWALRDNGLLYDTFIETMDRMAGFAGRGLLVPLGISNVR